MTNPSDRWPGLQEFLQVKGTGLCSAGLTWFQPLHSNEFYKEELGLFYRLFNLSLTPSPVFFFLLLSKLSLSQSFSIRGKVERLWVRQSMNARVQAAYQLREPERCPVDRFSNVKRAQSIWLTSSQTPCPPFLSHPAQGGQTGSFAGAQTQICCAPTVKSIFSPAKLPLRRSASLCRSGFLARRPNTSRTGRRTNPTRSHHASLFSTEKRWDLFVFFNLEVRKIKLKTNFIKLKCTTCFAFLCSLTTHRSNFCTKKRGKKYRKGSCFWLL